MHKKEVLVVLYAFSRQEGWPVVCVCGECVCSSLLVRRARRRRCHVNPKAQTTPTPAQQRPPPRDERIHNKAVGDGGMTKTNDAIVDGDGGGGSGCIEKSVRSSRLLLLLLLTKNNTAPRRRRSWRRWVLRAVALSVLVVACFAQVAVHNMVRHDDRLDDKNTSKATATNPKLTRTSSKDEKEEKAKEEETTAATTRGRRWRWWWWWRAPANDGEDKDNSLYNVDDDYERHDDDDGGGDTSDWYERFAATHSREWLAGPRLGNVIDMPNSYVKKLLARPMSDALLSYVAGEGQQVHDSDADGSDRTHHRQVPRGGGGGTASRHRQQRPEGLLPMYLSQSLCHPQSRFRDERSGAPRGRSNRERGGDGSSSSTNGLDDPNDDTIPPDEVKSWMIRLIYLSIIYHQHRYAIPEAKVRYTRHPSNNASRILAQHGVGNFDYECRGAKFIVASLQPPGLGATIRGWVVEMLLLGLMTDRVVLFVNGAPVGPKPSQDRWAIASCPRGDYQCSFFPASPCALTHADLESAPWLDRPFVWKLQAGEIPTDHANDKVWQIHEVFLTPDALPPFSTERLYNHSMALLGPALMATANTGSGSGSTTKTRQKVLRAAAERILQRWEPISQLHDYDNANVPIHHALTVFAMRPSFWSARSLLFASPAARHTPRSPDTKDPWTRYNIDPDNSVGLPIRGSDKCDEESECLTFQQHLEATSLLLEKYHSDLWKPQRRTSSISTINNTTTNHTASTPRIDPTLIITTESTAIAHELKQLRANHTALSTLPYRYRLVTNEADVTPNTGYYPDITLAGNGSNVTFTADEAVMSIFTTLQHQLLGRVTVVNCCSQFHRLLGDLLLAGCGAAAPPPAHALYCLQAPHVHPRYRVCCYRNEGCIEAKRLAVEEWERQQQQRRR